MPHLLDTRSIKDIFYDLAHSECSRAHSHTLRSSKVATIWSDGVPVFLGPPPFLSCRRFASKIARARYRTIAILASKCSSTSLWRCLWTRVYVSFSSSWHLNVFLIVCIIFLKAAYLAIHLTELVFNVISGLAIGPVAFLCPSWFSAVYCGGFPVLFFSRYLGVSSIFTWSNKCGTTGGKWIFY